MLFLDSCISASRLLVLGLAGLVIMSQEIVIQSGPHIDLWFATPGVESQLIVFAALKFALPDTLICGLVGARVVTAIHGAGDK